MNCFLYQFKYVKKVVASCRTEEQRDAARKWARDWSHRMLKRYPDQVKCRTQLYLDVIK